MTKENMFPIIHLLVVFDLIFQYDTIGLPGFFPEQRERVAGDVLTLNSHDRRGSWGVTERVNIFIKGLCLLNCTFVRFSWDICLSFITSETNREGKDKPRGQGDLFFFLELRPLLSVCFFPPLNLFLLRVRKSNRQNQRCASSSPLFQRHITQSQRHNKEKEEKKKQQKKMETEGCERRRRKKISMY